MPTTVSRLPEVIATLAQEVRSLAEREDTEELQPRAYPPASEQEIQRYEQHLGLKLPPSYRAFLELHNGYDWLAYPGHMLPIQSVMPGGEYYDEIQEWKKAATEYSGDEVQEGIVIACMEQPDSWVYLDPSRPTEDGELAVVEWEPEDAEEYPNLVEFLEQCIDACRADRDGEGEDEDDFAEEE